MSSMVEDRIEVGTSDLGNVFIFHFASADGETWQVRAGNHTVATVDSQSRAEAIARVLCGDDRLSGDAVPVADAIPPAMEKVVEETRKAVSKK